MKVINISREGKSSEITEYCSSINWSGDMDQAARKLELTLVDAAFDKNIPRIDVVLGSMIELLTDENKEIFRGYVFTREKDFGSQQTRVMCYDGMIYLTKSSASYNFKNISAEQITSMVCRDFGVPVGDLAKTGIKQESYIALNKSPYEIITKAYKEAARLSKQQYSPIMLEGKLNMLVKGSNEESFILDPRINLSSSRYSESIENMVNRVKIYDDKGNYLDEKRRDDWMNSYGVLQKAYTKEEGKDPSSIAENMLKFIERSGEVEAVGNENCIAGNAVNIRESYSGLKGLFFIVSDAHSWRDGKHTMNLTLEFKGMQDKKDGEDNAGK